ncbi:hypothetical protein NPX13_g11282 [Xylaria arbuscula]|nr:hypothetical protein NPX13_g11282 [Xylaria arbuscula]
MGRSGVVTLGNGVSTGQGTGVIFDGFETTLGAHGNRTSSGFAETTTDEDDEEDLSDYYDPRDLDDIE